jgi:hypothetical protein
VASAPPVFVLAPTRSYSSLVTQMLGCHPELYAFPELTLFNCETVAEWLARGGGRLEPGGREGWFAEAYRSGVLRAYAQLRFGGQTEAGVAAASRHVESLRDQRTRVILDELLECIAPRVGVEKSPATAMNADGLERLQRWYPLARFIHLVRHPVATCESLLRNCEKHYVPSMGELERWIPFAVLSTHRRIMAFLDRVAADRWRVVRSEDAVDDPAATLEPVVRWLGLRTDPEAIDQLRHPERSPFARVGPVGARGGNDAGFQREPAARPSTRPRSVFLRDDWRVTPRWREELANLAQELGYA